MFYSLIDKLRKYALRKSLEGKENYCILCLKEIKNEKVSISNEYGNFCRQDHAQEYEELLKDG